MKRDSPENAYVVFTESEGSVLSHEQNYNNSEDYQTLGLVNEVKAARFEGEIYSAMDGDVY